MPRSDARWVEVSPSQFAHEQAGLATVQRWLPNESPYRAWTNFEFRDGHGHWHECDLLVLAPGGLYLIELKHYYGTLDGDDRRWRRNGGRYEDSPLLLCRRKAQRLASKLKDAAKQWAREVGQDPENLLALVPYVQEAVFLHHETFRCLLQPSSALGLYGLEDAEDTSNLPPLSELVFQPPRSGRGIGPNADAILAKLMERIGLVPRRERQAGSWIIEEGVVDEGDGWQDWLCHHAADPTNRGRVRFQVPEANASDEDRQRRLRLARNEFTLARTLQHDAILTPRDLVESELGIGLVYDDDGSWQRLDLWMRERNTLPLGTALAITRQIGDALRYAHSHGIAHRALGVGAVWVRDGAHPTDPPQVRVRDWQLAGALEPTDTRHAVTNLAQSALPRFVATREAWMLEAFLAPETVWGSQERAKLDVFSLGALAAYLISGTPPAGSSATLRERLRSQRGIDVAVDVPVPEGIRTAVLAATRGVVGDRTDTVAEVLDEIDQATVETEPPREMAVDPLDARPGDVLGGRFEVEKRLGIGSTARGLLVTDRDAEGRPRRVLKVALNDAAADRIAGEAEVLRGLTHKRFAGLIEGPLDIDGRRALLLESAGTTTLADELRPGQSLPIDYLERWGGDLMEALVELDRLGLDHRDIKPHNLGVREDAGDRKKRLVLFDFSLTRAAADATSAGTPQYRDPFLGEGRRQRFDSHAERYSAAVVLHEMATGSLPRFGDGQTLPTMVNDEASIDAAAFAPSLARELAAFFTQALRRDARQRFETAQAMATAWAAIFATGTTTLAPTDDDDARAARAGLDTRIEEAGLTARALSALAPFGVANVRDFLTKVDAAYQYPRVAIRTRQHLKERRRTWAARLGDPRATRRGSAGDGVEVAAQVLLEAAGPASATVRRALLTRMLGRVGDADAFASAALIGAAMEEPLPPSRVQTLIGDLLGAWAADEEASALLDRVGSTLETRIVDAGGVVTLGEATSAVLDAVEEPTRGEATGRTARGLLRLALERLKVLRTEGGTQARPISVRRHGSLVALLATEPGLFDAVEAVGRAAEDLVTSTTGSSRSDLVPAATASRRLEEALAAFAGDGAEVPEALRVPGRLVRIGAELAPHGAAAANSDLHHVDLPAHIAVAETMRGFASRGIIKPPELRSRVGERFPALPPLPSRDERLDEIVRRAEVDLVWDEDKRGYRLPDHVPATTGLAASQTAPPVRGSVPVVRDAVAARLHESIAARGFLALGTPMTSYEEMVRALVQRYDADVVDVTDLLIDAMREAAAGHGVPWDVVLASDAKPTDSPDRANLDALVGLCLPAVVDSITAIIDSGDEPRPALLTEAAPLARYGHVGVLSRWTDMTIPRRRAVWLAVPFAPNTAGTLLDGVPLPLGSPGQFVRLDARWRPPGDDPGATGEDMTMTTVGRGTP
ncbi:BREX system serine/threonine kinase PglW [Mobilicoccus sp.]|uniref:BREX system serine/threonine kinase PglW n=1 Tax=Mobilicoccus sp. TaxID=2034349 RepID=UPI0028964A46|nr:BREX system serine/threonine kinase PglW [Mobilicoccus sp.]